MRFMCRAIWKWTLSFLAILDTCYCAYQLSFFESRKEGDWNSRVPSVGSSNIKNRRTWHFSHRVQAHQHVHKHITSNTLSLLLLPLDKCINKEIFRCTAHAFVWTFRQQLGYGKPIINFLLPPRHSLQQPPAPFLQIQAPHPYCYTSYGSLRNVKELSQMSTSRACTLL